MVMMCFSTLVVRGEGFAPEIVDEVGCFEYQLIYFARSKE